MRKVSSLLLLAFLTLNLLCLFATVPVTAQEDPWERYGSRLDRLYYIDNLDDDIVIGMVGISQWLATVPAEDDSWTLPENSPFTVALIFSGDTIVMFFEKW